VSGEYSSFCASDVSLLPVGALDYTGDTDQTSNPERLLNRCVPKNEIERLYNFNVFGF
jgi:hypothetical protein